MNDTKNFQKNVYRATKMCGDNIEGKCDFSQIAIKGPHICSFNLLTNYLIKTDVPDNISGTSPVYLKHTGDKIMVRGIEELKVKGNTIFMLNTSFEKTKEENPPWDDDLIKEVAEHKKYAIDQDAWQDIYKNLGRKAYNIDKPMLSYKTKDGKSVKGKITASIFYTKNNSIVMRLYCKNGTSFTDNITSSFEIDDNKAIEFILSEEVTEEIEPILIPINFIDKKLSPIGIGIKKDSDKVLFLEKDSVLTIVGMKMKSKNKNVVMEMHEDITDISLEEKKRKKIIKIVSQKSEKIEPRKDELSSFIVNDGKKVKYYNK